MDKPQEGAVLSPFAPTQSKKTITKEDMDAVKALLGVECLFIVADTEKHDCSEFCPGHDYSVAVDGFTEEQLAGFVVNAAGEVLGVDLVAMADHNHPDHPEHD